MRIPFIAAAAAAAVFLPALPASAQTPRQEYRENMRDVQRDCNRDLRDADSRRQQGHRQNAQKQKGSLCVHCSIAA